MTEVPLYASGTFGVSSTTDRDPTPQPYALPIIHACKPRALHDRDPSAGSCTAVSTPVPRLKPSAPSRTATHPGRPSAISTAATCFFFRRS